MIERLVVIGAFAVGTAPTTGFIIPRELLDLSLELFLDYLP